jgi:cob(I)alamin adenosyltransferase
MSPFYTRSGDDGYTGQLGAGRVPKYHPRTETVGAIDEASAALGVARAACRQDQTGPLIKEIQRDLYHLMAEAAATPENAPRFRVIDSTRVAWLEAQTDRLSEQVQVPRDFILPGDTSGGAALSLARAIIRRAERQLAYLLHQGEVENVDLLRYLNRLSSLCFVLELLENNAAGLSSPSLAKE